MRLAICVVVLLLASACLDSGSTPKAKRMGATSAQPAGVPFTGPAPTGCDAKRTAIFHSYDAEPVEVTMAAGIPCLVTSPYFSGEPSIGLTSKGTLFLYPGEVPVVPNAPDHGQLAGGLGMVRSLDQGGNWTRQFSQVGPVNWHAYTADPFMYVDPATDRIFMEDLMIPPFNCSNLSFSDDDGTTWKQTLGGCLVWDHVSFGAGKPVTSRPTGYPTIVYRCAITYIMTTVISEATGCQKSLDGGMMWQPPGQPAFLGGPDGRPYVPTTCHGAAHHVFVDQRGWVWLPRGWCGNPYVAVSKDEGATWTQYRVHDKPMQGHDAGIGVDANGTAYYFWMGMDNLPYLAVSQDDGKTWSAARKVSAPGVRAAGSPNLISGGVGKIAFSYGANLENDSTNGVHAVVAVGYDVDTDHPVFQSVFANPPDRPVATGGCRNNCPGQADFITLRIGPDGTPWMSVMDRGHVGAARLYGAPNLWDAADPNGPYK